ILGGWALLGRVKVAINALFPKHSLARGVGVLVSGTAGAQLLLIVAAPLLSRLYTPSEFGLLAVFTALLSVSTVLASGRYELAIPLPEKDKDAKHLLALSLICVTISTLAVLMGTVLWSTALAELLDTPDLTKYL